MPRCTFTHPRTGFRCSLDQHGPEVQHSEQADPNSEWRRHEHIAPLWAEEPDTPEPEPVPVDPRQMGLFGGKS